MSQIIIKNLINFRPPLLLLLETSRSVSSLTTTTTTTTTINHQTKNFLITVPPLSQTLPTTKVEHLNPIKLNTHYNLIGNNNKDVKDYTKPNEQINVNTNQQNKENDKASLEQLTSLEKRLQFEVPKFFTSSHNITLYSNDLVFIDNITGVKTKGLVQYTLRMNLIKAYYTIQYSSTKLELLNLVKNPEDSLIKIRWRIIMKPGYLFFLFFFWKFRSTEYWKDGISTLYVNNQGKIYCHVCDNIDVEIDKSKNKDKHSIKNRLVNRGLNV